MTAFVAILDTGLTVWVAALEVVVGGFVVRVASFEAAIAPGLDAGTAGAPGFFVGCATAFDAILVGGFGGGATGFALSGVARSRATARAGCFAAGATGRVWGYVAGDFVAIRGVDRGAAGTAGRFEGAATAGCIGAVAGRAPASAGVATEPATWDGALSGSREETIITTLPITTPVAIAETPTVIQLRVVRAGGSVATCMVSRELAGTGDGSGLTIEVES